MRRWNKWRKWGAELGLTPSSRARLRIQPIEQAADPLREFRGNSMKRKTKRKPAPRKTRDDCSTFDGDTAACQIVQLSDEIETLQNDVGDVLAPRPPDGCRRPADAGHQEP